MKYLFSLLLAAALFSCEKTDNANADLLGVWQLDAVYNDPGDGSGNYLEVDSGMLLEFLPDGRYTSVSSACLRSTNNESDSDTGSYDTEDSTIWPDLCDLTQPVSFDIEGEYLILSFPCIEPCLSRFTKAD